MNCTQFLLLFIETADIYLEMAKRGTLLNDYECEVIDNMIKEAKSFTKIAQRINR